MNKIIIITGCFLLVLILGMTLVLPKYQNFQVLQTSIKERERELQSKENYYSQIKEISEKFEEYEVALAKISSALPEDLSLSSLFHFLQQTSAQTGLVLENISLGIITEAKNEGLREIRLNIGVVGTYSAFKSFLSALENSSKIIEVDNISFQYSEDSASYFSFDLGLKTYSY